MIKKWVHKFREWGAGMARHRFAQPILFFLSVAESFFFPLPVDVMLIPMVLANRKKWKRMAFLAVAGSIVGAVLGYLLGMLLYDAVAQPIIQAYNLEAQIEVVGGHFERGAFLAILLSAFTPIPFKIFTIAGGLFRIAFIPFIIASIIGRGARFYLEAYLTHKAGEHVQPHKHPMWYGILGLLLAIAVVAYLVLK